MNRQWYKRGMLIRHIFYNVIVSLARWLINKAKSVPEVARAGMALAVKATLFSILKQMPSTTYLLDFLFQCDNFGAAGMLCFILSYENQ